jgi:phenylpyruvate tautomerase PptA (4-oxalocrotonate tautomerase family)
MGAIIGAVIAAGGAVYAASETKKAQKKAAGTQRNMQTEVESVTDTAPQILKLGQKYDYYAGQQQLGRMEDYMSRVMEAYPDLAYAEQQQTSLQRASDARDLNKSGRKMQSILEGMAPELKAGGEALLEMLRGVGEQSPLMGDLIDDARNQEMSPINQRLQEVAMRELGLGGELSADERRRVQQDSRAGFSARGMLGSDASTIEEVLNLGSARRQRELERIGLAGDINSRMLGEEIQDRNFGMGVEALSQQRMQADRAFIPAAIGAGNARLAPMMSLFNQRAGVQPGQVAGIFATAPDTTGTSARMISDVLNYGQDVADTNYNAAQAQAIARANNAAAIGGAAMSVGGTISAAGIQANARKPQPEPDPYY